MTDWSYEARRGYLEERRTARMQIPFRDLPQMDLPPEHDGKVLDLLDESQYMRVALFGVQIIEQVKAERLHGLIRLKGWFYKLDAAQRAQVIDYYDSLLVEHSLALEWYARGHHYGYRFVQL